MFPIRHTLTRSTRTVVGKDSRGNPIVEWVEVDWPVFGYSPGAPDEPDLANRDLSSVVWTVYAPSSSLPDRMDRVVVEGELFEVDGEPSDWSKGPWPGFACATVLLKRMEG